jgi:LysR family transcriptional regulator, nitrogen assimilation regulatory protein
MDSRQLRYFCAIYEQRTLSGAADHLRIAASALSYHLTNMEAQLGGPLFARKARGLAPTAAGDRLYTHAKSILYAIEAAERDITSARQEITGHLAIGLGHTTIKAIGIDLIREVTIRHPRLRLAVSESLSGGHLANLLAREIELAVFYNPPVTAGVSITPILEEPLVCLGRPELIGSTSDPIPFDEVLKLPVISLRHGISARGIIDNRDLLDRLETSAQFELNSAVFVADALLEGIGCAIINPLFVRGHVEAGTLHIRPIVAPQLYRTLVMCELENRRPSFAAEAVKGLILDLVGTAVSSGVWKARLLG